MQKQEVRRGQKIVGRKRNIVVDTDGGLLMVNLTTADISDAPTPGASTSPGCQNSKLWNSGG